jgi:hypothetical protein
VRTRLFDGSLIYATGAEHNHESSGKRGVGQGLSWNPACLDFRKTQRTVVTASTWQVRQPIYTRSVARWRNYEKHLGPLLEVLAKGTQSD